jgi:hypothetical protein
VPRCCGPLKIVSLIDAASIIERILGHLKLWDRPERAPPAPGQTTLYYDFEIRTWNGDVGGFDGTE